MEEVMVDDNDRAGDGKVGENESNGASMSFRRITVKVEERESKLMGLYNPKTGNTRELLVNVSGKLERGQMMYIMGPSGSGKSTTLDVLSTRSGLPFEGSVFLDGAPVEAHKLKETARFVQQDDALQASLTVYETLMVCARLSWRESADQLEARVEDVMRVLGLTAQRDVKVGGVFFRGLSGGQKRRLSVACELIARPRLLLLDEPTTGLDAAAAFHVMKSLLQAAREYDVSVIATIHAPAQAVLEMSDVLLLLTAGKTAYFGPTSGAERALESALDKQRPRDTATAEWMLDVINGDFDEECAASARQAAEVWASSEESKQLDALLSKVEEAADSGSREGIHAQVHGKLRVNVAYRASWFTQVRVLLARTWKTMLRDPSFVWLRLVMYMMLGLAIGLVWLQLGDSAGIVRDLAGGLWYIIAFYVFMAVAAIPAYIEEKHVLTRERANGYYSVSAAIISKAIVDVPFQLVLALGPGTVSYWLIGMQADAAKYFIYIALLFLALYASESFMLLIAAATDYALLGLAFGAAVYGAFMTTIGYLKNLESMTWVWRWMNYISWEYYGWTAMMVNEMTGRTFQAGESWGQFSPQIDGTVVLDTYQIGGVKIWVNVLALIGLSIVVRIACALWTHFVLTGQKRK
eukprot:CAMPEP_0185848962 /NCGR_PEP_ID=MMETSP1354-20130828/3649_1 /TAXON_ID=708628 /ORGANISM="Erythrolobus madagascarensis, Strain CCMP3276" /LENGTH=636 /DNA_ID=CAMNT_0028549429 /DNA_START=180 /DNA_END=2090 /DNA_ORIENTATION=+